MFEYRAQVIRVVDGDTLILDVDLGLRSWVRGKPYRMGRINAPEMSTPEGPLARYALVAQIGSLPAEVVIKTTKDKRDPYDRYIVEVVQPDGTNLNDWMLAGGYAVPYPKK